MSARSLMLCTNVLGAAVLASSAAAAQTAPGDTPLGRSLHGQAKDAYVAAATLYERGDYPGAEAKYKEAHDLAKDPRLVFDMAACEKQLHKYAHMGALLRQYKEEAGATLSADDRAKVDGVLDALPRFVGTVAVAADPAGATVVVDGEAVGATPLVSSLWLDPGKHTVVVSKEGFESVERPISVSAGTSTTVSIALLAQAKAGTASGATPTLLPQPVPPIATGGARWSPLVYAGFGLAGAGLIAGSVTGAIAIGKASSLGGSCENKACPPSASSDLSTGRTMGNVSTVSFVVAGIGAAVGIVALLVVPHHESDAKTANTVVPLIGASSTGLAWTF
jgi:hypothetical protein